MQEGIIHYRDLKAAKYELERADAYMQETLSKCKRLLEEAEQEATERVMHAEADLESRYSTLEKALSAQFNEVIHTLHARQRDIETELHESCLASMKKVFAKVFDGADFHERTEIMLYQLAKHCSSSNTGVFKCNTAQKMLVENWLCHNQYNLFSVEVDDEQEEDMLTFVSDNAKFCISWNAFTSIFR